MNRMARELMKMHLVRGIAMELSALFLTLFLWKHADLQTVAVFWIVHFLVLPLVFLALGEVVKKRTRLLPIQIGLGLAAVFFFVITVLREQAITFVVPLAAFLALVNGFHWLPFNTLSFDANDPGTRGKFYGTLKAATKIIRFVTPIVAGALIVLDPLGMDYGLVFGLSCAFFAFAFLKSLTITKSKVVKVKTRFTFLSSAKKFLTNKDYQSTIFASVVKGSCYRGASDKIVFLLFFLVTGNEFQTGSLAGFLALVAVISSLWVSRQKESGYLRIAAMGALGYFLGTLVFVLWPGFWSLVVFSVLMYFFDPFIDVPQCAIAHNVVNKYKNVEERVEYFVLKELFLDFGRVISFSVLFLVATISFESVLLRYLLVAMAAGIFLLVFLLNRIKFPKKMVRLPAN